MPLFSPLPSALGTTSASVSTRSWSHVFNVRCTSWIQLIVFTTEIKKVLKPDVFQEFPLQEKTIISHNVAM
jgi:cytochrome-b5 reductase